MGIAMSGTAFNGAYLFCPLGGFIGWLVSRKLEETGETSPEKSPDPADPDSDDISNTKENTFDHLKSADTIIPLIIYSALAIAASVWNFHIDLLKVTGLLPTFVENPWLFVILCVVITFFVQPFLAIYSVAYLAASHFGASEKTDYRAVIH